MCVTPVVQGQWHKLPRHPPAYHQKRPTIGAKETCCPRTVAQTSSASSRLSSKETYYSGKRDLLSKDSGTNFLGILPLIINEKQGGVPSDEVRGAIAQPQLTCAWIRFRVQGSGFRFRV